MYVLLCEVVNGEEASVDDAHILGHFRQLSEIV